MPARTFPAKHPLKDAIISAVAHMTDIVIVGHKSPDPDAKSSSHALALILRDYIAEQSAKLSSTPDELPEVYVYNEEAYDSWMGQKYTGVPDVLIDEENVVVIIVDCDSHARTGAGEELAEPFLVLDHHLGVTKDAAEVVVHRPDLASTCGIVAHLADSGGMHISKTAATILYAGMIADTGGFSYSNTTAETLRAAQIAVAAGADSAEASSVIWAKPMSRLAVEREYWANLKMHSHAGVDLATSWISLDVASHIQSTKGEDEFAQAIGGLVNKPLSIEHCDISILVVESHHDLRISFRARGYPIRDVAVTLGGGGHKEAAGAMVPMQGDNAGEPFAEMLARMTLGMFDADKEGWEVKPKAAARGMVWLAAEEKKEQLREAAEFQIARIQREADQKKSWAQGTLESKLRKLDTEY